MKVKINRWYNAILTALLSVLGYGCSSEEPMDMYGTIVEYGCPHADYVVKGTITDEGGKPIKGIKVTAPNGSSYDSQYQQIVQTDASGNFALKEFSSMRGSYLFVEDIDGEDNGGDFKSDTIDVRELPHTQVEKGERWYNGKYEATATIKLKKK